MRRVPGRGDDIKSGGKIRRLEPSEALLAAHAIPVPHQAGDSSHLPYRPRRDSRRRKLRIESRGGLLWCARGKHGVVERESPLQLVLRQRDRGTREHDVVATMIDVQVSIDD